MLKSVSVKTEEIVNVITAGIGIVLSIIALIFMVVRSVYSQDIVELIASIIFGISLILAYIMATLFHGTKNIRKKYFLNKLDHSSVYLLIAGTYTPITIVLLQGSWGWSLFFMQWFLAISGILFKLFWYKHKYRKISAYTYIIMGALIIFATNLLLEKLPLDALFWLAIGAVSYVVGAIFYLQNKLFFHGIWHIFVLTGSISHFIFIYFHIL